MNRLLKWGRGRLLLGVACGLGMMALAAGEARAASLTLTVSESAGGASIAIADNSALDTNPAVGVIDVNVALLNPSLNNYTFTSLSANSNAPGTATVGALSQNGTAVLNTGSGTGSLTITASDVDYNLPTGPAGRLASSASNTYTHANNGNTTTFTSWYNPSNTLNATDVASGTVNLIAASPPDPNSHSGNGTPTITTPLTTPYGLTNTTVITLTGGSPGAAAQDQFTGSTTLAAVPEPASLALMLTAVPVTLFGALRRRKAAE